jgi:hypothetical protein
MATPETVTTPEQTLPLVQGELQDGQKVVHPESLPGIPKVDSLRVRLKDGERQLQAELVPAKNPQSGTTHITGRSIKGEQVYFENRYSYGPEVVALQWPAEGQEPVWEIVDGGVALYPVITYEGLKIAIFNRRHNQ